MSWCGLLNVHKPAALTSRQVVDHIQRLVHPAKVGHAGTLDPLATGVLLVCVGPATRLISRVQEGRKRYVGRFRLGQRSDTEDIDGEVVAGGDWSGVTRLQLEQLLPEFVGSILQTPPQISALKVGGQRAYKLARRGHVVDLKPRPVEVFSLELTEFEPPEFELRVECGSGTYIRSLGRDIGERLGCGAVMSTLCRTAIGRFRFEESVTLEALNATTLPAMLVPPQAVLPELPRRKLDPAEIVAVRQGRVLPRGAIIENESSPRVRSHGDDPRDAAPDDTVFSGEVVMLDASGAMIGLALIDRLARCLRPTMVIPALRTEGLGKLTD